MKSKKSKLLTPTELVIARFGGTFKVAELLNIVPSGVSNWHSRSSVPAKHRLKLLELARTLQIPLNSHELDFGGKL